MVGQKYRLFGVHQFRTIKQKVNILLENYFWFCVCIVFD